MTTCRTCGRAFLDGHTLSDYCLRCDNLDLDVDDARFAKWKHPEWWQATLPVYPISKQQPLDSDNPSVDSESS